MCGGGVGVGVGGAVSGITLSLMVTTVLKVIQSV